MISCSRDHRLADRYGALRHFVDKQPEALLPVTRDILLGETQISRAATFSPRSNGSTFSSDKSTSSGTRSISSPSRPPARSTASMTSRPTRSPSMRNSGPTRTSSIWPISSAVAVPSGFLPSGLPQGISLIAPAFADHRAAALAQHFHEVGQLPLGARDARPAADPTHTLRHQETVS